MLMLGSDYQEGCHINILNKLIETNDEKTSGYGSDIYTLKAKEYIKDICDLKGGSVYLLVGGTQTNALVIKTFLKPYEGVISADSGHINTHEAGAIECGGHKVLVLPNVLGKIDADMIDVYCANYCSDGNHEHMVAPGMVYLSQPTEFGTLYTKEELIKIREVCDKYKMRLFIDGARLAYALASKDNDVTLADLAKLCDVFYIGGTKCGALFGEALVLKEDLNLTGIIKQNGALLAKGRLLGIQFYELFKDGLYLNIAKKAIELAQKLNDALVDRGYKMVYPTRTNQLFIEVSDDILDKLKDKVVYSFWEKKESTKTIIRLVVSWSTKEEEIDELIDLLDRI